MDTPAEVLIEYYSIEAPGGGAGRPVPSEAVPAPTAPTVGEPTCRHPGRVSYQVGVDGTRA